MTPEEIREVRDSLGATQEEFARMLRVSFTAVSRWENGRARPDREMAEQLRAVRDLLAHKEADRGKIRETLATVGVGSAVTLAATAGLISSRAILFALGPLGMAAAGLGILGGLFLRQIEQKNSSEEEAGRSPLRDIKRKGGVGRRNPSGKPK